MVVVPEGGGAIRALLRGQLATFAVPGEGYARRPVPEDALWVDLDTATVLLAASSVRAALAGERVRTGASELRCSPAGDALLIDAGGSRAVVSAAEIVRLLSELTPGS
jgi:hypothetical protein